MKKVMLLLLPICLLVSMINAQDTTSTFRHTVAMQFGGQSMVSGLYGYKLKSNNFFDIQALVGIGLFEYADDTNSDDRPISNYIFGLSSLWGRKKVFLELNVLPTLYKHKSFSAMNVNAWTGIRFGRDVYCSIGYTPCLYTSVSSPEYDFTRIVFGIKGGIMF